ncbi:MAG: helix-turn-helix transcriptional regulator [Firmicutes bacterium]|nr:helix-turn-helix transcriptional regulator [Bacillota bacterium]
MAVSYKKLWHLLIDKDLKKTELREMCGISPATMAKLTKGDNITTDILLRICKALNCDIADIMEIVIEAETARGK